MGEAQAVMKAARGKQLKEEVTRLTEALKKVECVKPVIK